MAEYEVDVMAGMKRRVASPAYLVNYTEGVPEDGPQLGDRVVMTNNLGIYGEVTNVYDVMSDNGMGHRYGVRWDNGVTSYPPPTCSGRPSDGMGHDEALMQYIPHPQMVIFKCPSCGRQWQPPASDDLVKEMDKMDRHIRQPFGVHLRVVTVPRLAHAPVLGMTRKRIVSTEGPKTKRGK